MARVVVSLRSWARWRARNTAGSGRWVRPRGLATGG
jgi:hypothetical protein